MMDSEIVVVGENMMVGLKYFLYFVQEIMNNIK